MWVCGVTRPLWLSPTKFKGIFLEFFPGWNLQHWPCAYIATIVFFKGVWWVRGLLSWFVLVYWNFLIFTKPLRWITVWTFYFVCLFNMAASILFCQSYISLVGIGMTKSRRYLNRGAIHMIVIHIIAYDASLKSHFSKRFSLKGPVLQVESCSIYV